MKQRWQEDHEHLWRRRLRGWETDSEKELGKVIDKICLNLKVDTLELLGNNGHFNSRDMYSKLDHSNQVPGTWHQFWKLRLPSRIKIFIWKVMNQVLTVRAFLKNMIAGIDEKCSFCLSVEENIVHLLWNCPFSVKVWDDIREWWKIDLDIEINGTNLLPILKSKEITSSIREVWVIVVCLAWWHIWKARNIKIIQGFQLDHGKVMDLIKKEALSIGISHDWLSCKVATLWYIDPKEAITNYSISKRSSFVSRLFNSNNLVGFSDGAWHPSECKGGVGGVIFSSPTKIFFYITGPMITNNALGAELEACKSMWLTLGEFEDYKPKVLCVDSKNLVDLFNKAKAGLENNRKEFEIIKNLTVRFPHIKLLYINRRWNWEADTWAKIGAKRNRTIKIWL